MPWHNHPEVQSDGSVHVWPEANDREPEHDVSPGSACWCRPVVFVNAVTDNYTVEHRDELDRLELE